jgi:hypothetical protein
VSGRSAEARVGIDPDSGNAMIAMPAPGTGVFDWYELDVLAAAIAEVRRQMGGRPGRPRPPEPRQT